MNTFVFFAQASRLYDILICIEHGGFGLIPLVADGLQPGLASAVKPWPQSLRNLGLIDWAVAVSGHGPFHRRYCIQY